MRRHHLYATYKGVEYWLGREVSSWTLLSEGPVRPGPEWRPRGPMWELPVTDEDIESAFSVHYRGSFRGVPVSLSPAQGSRVRLISSHISAGEAVGMTRFDKDGVDIVVEEDDPDLQFEEIITEMPPLA